MKFRDLREMSDEQLEITAREAADSMFRLSVQSASERLDVPSQKRNARRLIAKVRTLQTQRLNVK